jgi:glycosyltransferase involved in cell wall biosynthesis
MISWDLDPFRTRGGTAYAIRRLADQLTELEIETRVLLPDCPDVRPGNEVSPLLKPMFLKTPPELDRASRGVQCSEFARVALDAVEELRTSAGTDAVVAHSLEGAMSIILRSGKRSSEPSVFWLHSLYDPPLDDLSDNHRGLLPFRTLLASAVMMADVVVTSAGILKDASEFEWPDRLKELQEAVTIASAERRVLTVESMGCLPTVPRNSRNKLIPNSDLENLESVPSPYVLFPGRPSIDKGLGIFAAIAERLRADKITCVAVEQPAHGVKSENPFRDAPIRWLPWLTQNELAVAMRNAACSVLPSITEGFGLAAAESISQGVTTLYQQVGGHHGLDVFPNALPVPLTTSERAQLYRLWSELFGSQDYRSVWSEHEISLSPLIDRWVEAIRSVVYRADARLGRVEIANFPERPVEERWGNRLRHRIEVGTDV